MVDPASCCGSMVAVAASWSMPMLVEISWSARDPLFFYNALVHAVYLERLNTCNCADRQTVPTLTLSDPITFRLAQHPDLRGRYLAPE